MHVLEDVGTGNSSVAIIARPRLHLGRGCTATALGTRCDILDVGSGFRLWDLELRAFDFQVLD